jgi:hypothetical protein
MSLLRFRRGRMLRLLTFIREFFSFFFSFFLSFFPPLEGIPRSPFWVSSTLAPSFCCYHILQP